MSSTSTSQINTILSGAETYAASQTPKTGNTQSLGKDAFLTLLVAQLKNQDPMKPVADTEFVAQLAQFTSLEQLTNISEGIGKLNNNSTLQELSNSSNFIGKQVRAEGDSIYKEKSNVGTAYYSLTQDAANVMANIFDSNGNIVRTLQLGSKTAGSYQLNWDGKNYNGQDMADGTYKIAIGAEDVKGAAVLAKTEVSGTVDGIGYKDGKTYLRLKDGRQVEFSKISEIVNPTTASSKTGSTTN